MLLRSEAVILRAGDGRSCTGRRWSIASKNSLRSWRPRWSKSSWPVLRPLICHRGQDADAEQDDARDQDPGGRDAGEGHAPCHAGDDDHESDEIKTEGHGEPGEKGSLGGSVTRPKCREAASSGGYTQDRLRLPGRVQIEGVKVGVRRWGEGP